MQNGQYFGHKMENKTHIIFRCIFGILLIGYNIRYGPVRQAQSATRFPIRPPINAPAAGGCSDQGQDCPLRLQLCNNTLYSGLMSWQCPRSCNRCPPRGASPTRPPNIQDPPLPNRNCRDFRDCPTWVKNGFCTLYKNDTKADFCPISCRVGCAIGGRSNYGG